MSQFGLIRPFGIDNGELDGMTPQQCFVLGYELARFDMLLIQHGGGYIDRRGFDSGFEMYPVHVDNIERMRSEAVRRKFRFEVRFTHADQGEEWATVICRYAGRDTIPAAEGGA